MVYTGKNTMTGGRIKLLKKHIKSKTFMCTYGDGVANINLIKPKVITNKDKGIITNK